MAVLNVPNFLTALRLVGVPVFAWLFLEGRLGWALIVFVGAEITDVLDGVLARALRQFTRLGAIMDPIADKLLGLTALSLLTYTRRLPLWLFAAALFRDACIAAAVYLLTRSGRTFPARPSRFGKYATFFLGATVLVALAHAARPETADARPALFALSLIATECLAISWAQYLSTWIKLMKRPPEEVTT
jgi:cardiolipin synthase